ncbi:hypothetical protein Bcav_3618 [Beutenbergia cavernae DSM 12333]|uniref:Rhamnogalacturonase A/B/Epimerase-like pectate lyase domain-containing protein n=1 Tax=Beutenbergia cavernae (strain ATCC BAA-8 / DSM 12333 / CCUG 43141 / JCM 11478 / NBRC 16432 / NCIMB 13614 / HKI 0122) TaxID=471853 RepID=C5C316_BEUC1|nr:glycosyl hydrolase family 28-related protein [Beutenbergia cavernae]ACQ81860.1 hypothetical protein Bcav_3618 [Beutenbergia cavernae DSM 12333]
MSSHESKPTSSHGGLTRRTALTLGAVTALAGVTATAAQAAPAPSRRPLFDVRDFGAVGDGVVDDTDAFNRALDAVEANGGGTVYFPPGTYPVSGNEPAIMRDNLDIVGEDATILKAVRNGSTFISLSRGRTGYGSGVRNLRVRGLRFLGSYAGVRLQCPFALHHASNVVIEDCVFEQVQGSRHCVDLGGCEDVVIRRCTWLGFYNNEGPAYAGAECIQVDYSYSGALSYTDSPGSHDGLLSRRITVEDCEFLPLVADGVTYPCPNPLGIHGVKEDAQYSDIVFRRNLVLDPGEGPAAAWPDDPTKEATAYARGVVHLPTTRRVRIEGNTFRQTTGRVTRALSFGAASYVITTGSDPNTFPPTKTVLASPVGCDDIRITNNVFEGFAPGHADAPAQEAVWFHGLPNGGEIRDVVVSGNTFRDLDAGGIPTAPAISATHATGLRVENNAFSSASRAIWTAETTSDVRIRGNRVVGATGATGADPAVAVHSTGYSVMHNDLDGGSPRPGVAIEIGAGTHGRVMHNAVSDYDVVVVAPDPLPHDVVVRHNG